MHVGAAFIVAIIAWAGAFVLSNFNPYMIVMAPFVVSALTLICCIAPWRPRRALDFEPGIIANSLER